MDEHRCHGPVEVGTCQSRVTDRYHVWFRAICSVCDAEKQSVSTNDYADEVSATAAALYFHELLRPYAILS